MLAVAPSPLIIQGEVYEVEGRLRRPLRPHMEPETFSDVLYLKGSVVHSSPSSLPTRRTTPTALADIVAGIAIAAKAYLIISNVSDPVLCLDASR